MRGDLSLLNMAASPLTARRRIVVKSTAIGIAFAVVLLLLLGAQGVRGESGTFVDNFNGGALDPSWSTRDGYALNNPADTANHASFGLTGSQLSIAFPGGTEHNMWWLEHAQVDRAYAGSAVYELKQDSALDGSQQFGLVFESSPGTFLIFMLYGHGPIWGYAERFSTIDGYTHKKTFPGSWYNGHDTGLSVPHGGPFWIRVIVDDDPLPELRTWTFQWSIDGSNWTTALDGTIESAEPEHNIGAIQRVGLFAGNQPDHFSAFDARFDYFRYYPADALPVQSPANLIANAGDQQVQLEWGSVAGAHSYNVYRAETPGGPYAPIANSSQTALSDMSVVNGTTYFYVVTTLTGNGSESANSAEVAATPEAPPPMPEPPAELPADGLVLLLDAGNVSGADGSEVTSWLDASGAGAHGSGTSGSAPVLVADGVGGQPALRFDGANDYLNIGAGFSDFTAGGSIFIVAKPTAAAAGAKLLTLGNGAGSANVVLGRNGSGDGLQYFTTNAWGSYGWFGTGDALVSGEAALYSVVQPGGAAGDTVTASVLRNGLEVGSGNVFVPPVTARSLNYLGRSYWGGDAYFAGDIAEVIVYNRQLSPAEQATVEGYLSGKYGIAAELPPLDGPAGVSASAGDGEVTVTWQAVESATGYSVQRSDGGAFVEVANVSGTSHLDSGLTNGVTYSYQVAAYDAERVSEPSAIASATPQTVLTVPAELPADGLVLLLDAGNVSGADGSEVTSWLDASGAGAHGSGTSGSAPVLVADGVGGQPALRFDGANDYLNIGAGFSDFTAGGSIFIVAKPSAAAAGAKMLTLGNGAGSANVVLGRNGSGDGLQYFTTNAWGSYGWFGTGDALVSGEAALYSVVQPGGAAGDTVTASVLRNGLEVGSGNVFVPPVTARSLNYLGRSYWGGDAYFAGDIAEVIVYNRQLSPAEQATVEGYLSGKYGIAAELPPLDGPAGVSASAGDGEVTVTWQAVEGATGYSVQRSDGGAFVEVANVSGTSHLDSGLTNGVTYSYQVAAYDAERVSEPSAIASATPQTVLTVPAELPADGLVLLLDAGNVSGADGSEVTSWLDASGEGAHGSGTTGSAPVLVADGIGGQPALRFDGANDYLNIGAGFSDFTAGGSIFMVAKPSSAAAGAKLLTLGNGAGSANVVLGRNGSGDGLQYFTTNAWGSYGWFGTGDALVSGEAALYSVVQPGGAAGDTVTASVLRNGLEVGSGNVFVPPVTARSLNYLGRSYWGGDAYFAGDIAEVIVYNRQLSPAEQATVESYLSKKYGLQ